jgi:galactoside O-acetyltransferase
MASKLRTLTIGPRSRVAFWRIRSSKGNVLAVGERSMIETKIAFEREGASVRIGHRSFIGQGVISVASSVDIGDDVMIAWGTVISDHGSHSARFSERQHDVVEWLDGRKRWDGIAIAPIQIGDKAWVGLNCILMKGISIGEGAIVGAGSVVTRDVPPWTIVAGNPARVIREIPVEER